MTNDFFPSATRRDFLRLGGALAAAATFAGGLSACGATPADQAKGSSSGAAQPKADGTITAALSYELGTNGFDPMTTSAALCLAANWHTMEGLTEILPTGTREVYPAVAKELPKKVDDTTYEAVIRAPMPWAEASPAWSPCWTPSGW